MTIKRNNLHESRCAECDRLIETFFKPIMVDGHYMQFHIYCAQVFESRRAGRG